MNVHSIRLFLSLGILLLAVSQTMAEKTVIKFQELEELYSNSPSAENLDHELNRLRASRNQQFEWSNPSLGFEREDIDQSSEYSVTIGKEFELPWVRASRKNVWQHKIKAASLNSIHNRRIQLTKLKTLYVSLRLNNQLMSHMDDVALRYDKATAAASRKHEEGFMAGIDAHLVEMASIRLFHDRAKLSRDSRELEGNLRVLIGLNTTEDLDLATEVSFNSVGDKLAGYDSQFLAESPVLQARESESRAHKAKLQSEKLKLVPTITATGGYRRIDDQFSGYTAGISFPLPIGNQNKAAVSMAQISNRIAENEFQINRMRLESRMQLLLESIIEMETQLVRNESKADQLGSKLEQFSTAYSEGFLSPTEFITAIDVELDGITAWHDLLRDYYTVVFELESLIGETLVTFEGENQ